MTIAMLLKNTLKACSLSWLTILFYSLNCKSSK
jgi:hypothetical protein